MKFHNEILFMRFAAFTLEPAQQKILLDFNKTISEFAAVLNKTNIVGGVSMYVHLKITNCNNQFD
jgi:hypothetical protein